MAKETGPMEFGFKKLELKAGHSVVAKLPKAVKRISVGEPKIADVLVINPRQIYVNGKSPGSTNLTMWDNSERLLGIFEVRVARDLTRLKEHLFRIMPNEAVEVREMEGAVLLSGKVSSSEAKTRAEAVAKAFAPKNVTSVLKVGGSQQVLLKVRFAEVSRRALKKLNFNLGFFNPAGAFGFTFLDQLAFPTDTAIGLDSFSTKLDFSSKLNGMFGFNAGGARFMGFIDALKENGPGPHFGRTQLGGHQRQEGRVSGRGRIPHPGAPKGEHNHRVQEIRGAAQFHSGGFGGWEGKTSGGAGGQRAGLSDRGDHPKFHDSRPNSHAGPRPSWNSRTDRASP